jgi:anti-sigma regulatory factor (Ser/Thr protein kinase)
VVKPYELRLHHGSAIRLARLGIREWLDGMAGRPGFADDVELVVSELVTNALTHSDEGAELRAEVIAGVLHLEVADCGADGPAARPPQGPLGGYGLHIVDALSVDWGWNATPHGKIVWADMAPNGPAPRIG